MDEITRIYTREVRKKKDENNEENLNLRKERKITMAPNTTKTAANSKDKKEASPAKRSLKLKSKAAKSMLDLAKETGRKTRQTTLGKGFKSVKIKQEILKKTSGDAYNKPKDSKDNGKEKKENENVRWSDMNEEEDDEVEFVFSGSPKQGNCIMEVDDIASSSDEDAQMDEEKEEKEEEESSVYKTPQGNRGKRKVNESEKEKQDSLTTTNTDTPKEPEEMIPPIIKNTSKLGTVTPERNIEDKEEQKENSEPTAKKQVKLASYASATKGKKRATKENMVRLRFRYSAPKESNQTKAPIAELTYNLVEIAKQVDSESMIMPWEDTTDNLGPLNLQDFNYANKVTIGDMKKYLDLPFDVKTQGFTPGRMEYQIGVRFTTTKDARTFKNAWDLQKKERTSAKKKFIAADLAEHQESPRAYLIGVAAGSTEKMEFKSINEGLAKATGIKNIAVNYQTFHQVGITKPMWNIAYKKADKISDDKRSRIYNQTKYAWAPQGLCVYVTDKSVEREARLKMLELYGECNEDGKLPVWPGGSTMRFIPLKSTYIKNSKTRNKVEKRIKFHIYQKVEEVEIPTMFSNIYDSIESFGGKTFQEMIMQIESKEVQGLKLFRHFNHVWDRDPSLRKWAISTHTRLHEEAINKIKTIKDEFVRSHGTIAEKFFREERTKRSYYADKGKSKEEEDEDDWFKDSDIISANEKNIFVEGITEAMFETRMSGTDEPSWGSVISNISPTGETKASTSTLTRSTLTVTDAQVEQRKLDLAQTLSTKGISAQTIEKMMGGQTPYDLVSGCFKTDEYTHEGMVTLLCNLQLAYASLPEGSNTKEQENNEMETERDSTPTGQGAGKAQTDK